MMKRVMVISVLLVGVVAIYAYLQYNKPHRDIAGEEAFMAIQASVLFDNYVQDEAAANKNYLDKVLIVNGTVRDNEISENGSVVTLATHDDFFGIKCDFDTPVDLTSGQQVSIKGHCTGFAFDVTLIKCTLQ